jgi:alkylated DNA repair protein (DNA oxidative demethylase)
MKAAKLEDLPVEGHCNHCDKTKPRAEMIVTRLRAEKVYYMRPKCKECHNAHERGYRRDYKRLYLQKWRKNNADVNTAYWKDNPVVREKARITAAVFRSNPDNKDAVAIQRRMRKRGHQVTLEEARELLAKYGRCYPTRYGLTTQGRRECERIRSRQRGFDNRHRRLSSFDIRLMVYEDSDENPVFLIPPAKQIEPYQKAARNMRNYQRSIGSELLVSPAIFNNLPAGTFHLKNFANEELQLRLVDLCRQLVNSHPLMQPRTKTGYDLSLRVTSWGQVGWFGDLGRYYYMKRHANGKLFPMIPLDLQLLMQRAVSAAGFGTLKLDTVLLNFYPPRVGKLGRHQDVTEDERESPIVTVSLGDSCIFNIGDENRKSKGVDIELQSGDVVVMGGPSRLAFHEVKRLIPETSTLLKCGGRISLTGRRVFKSERTNGANN